MSRERLGNVLPDIDGARLADAERHPDRGSSEGGGIPLRVAGTAPAVIPIEGDVDPEAEAKAFVRFCYRRRAVAWPELYDEMCAVAARGDYRGMDYEQLRGVGIGFALAALPRLAQLAAYVIAEERVPQRAVAIA